MNEERVTTLKTKLPNLIYLVLAFFVQLKLATYLRQYTPNNSLQHLLFALYIFALVVTIILTASWASNLNKKQARIIVALEFMLIIASLILPSYKPSSVFLELLLFYGLIPLLGQGIAVANLNKDMNKTKIVRPVLLVVGLVVSVAMIYIYSLPLSYAISVKLAYIWGAIILLLYGMCWRMNTKNK
ncbi:hypothetical protein ABZU09_05710 [Lactobacillus mulieris]|jgi:hypothetical protein|uniref:Uncharacterized protein n=1 Tax=Lactobacillus mulieris TaxID=2508708 RepID=A0AAP3GXA6_9LACO|nr:hypothetical protein [Lactobacillus mulieris]EEU21764.1 hypothetical protein HMPREF0525_00698 [Lactobacillus jensenii 27-2-CHN]EEX24634.1 hypothetical protein HMPREF0974_00439 [Lactobacillus jensenii 115-3-CHN]EFH29751.1 hypothetical protein HMPREF0526_11354 [Lactobacillus jensenii JV-V16]KAA9243725.1 hypothetical protein F6I33_06170 [Lactobacillus jensenii]TRT37175.1 hypothetical protein ETI26_04510 [Lactobacillus sp. c10Ua232AE]